MKLFINLLRYLNFQIKRLRYLKATPHDIALGFSFGVWTNFNPIFGANLLIAMGLAFIFRVNIIASVIGTLLTGLPFVFPFFWIISWFVGSQLILNNFDQSLLFENDTIVENITEYFAEMLVGSFVLFPIVICISYFPVRFLVKYWQEKRNLRRNKENG